MPHFSFRLHCPGEPVEVEDVELPDPEAARREALQACGDLIREIDGFKKRLVHWEIEVVGEDGGNVFVLRLTAEDFTTG